MKTIDSIAKDIRAFLIHISMDKTERYKKLAAAVEALSETEVEEIFKMIHKYGCNYTKNNNGVFVNLAWLPEDLLAQLERYVEFCNKSDIEIRKYESLCDVLNSRLGTVEDTETPVKHTNKLDADDEDDTNRMSKLSSTTRFMMMKKKYSKNSTFPALENDLERDAVFCVTKMI